MVAVVQGDSHVGKSLGLSHLGSRKDDILHAGAAQLLDALLTQYPAHGVGYIALAAAIGTHDAGDAVMEFKYQLIGKGFKPLNLNTF
jgi:hypothetical protein